MRAVSIAFLFVGAGVLPAACSSSDDASPTVADAGTDAPVVSATDAGSTGSTDATGAADGAVPPPPPPAGCVEDADAKTPEAGPCVTDSFAVFADASAGADQDDGSQMHPKKTLTAALAAAKAANKQRIYVCGAGPYQEHVTFDHGARVIGGFACGSWKYDGTRARIAPKDAGPALRASNVADPILLSDLEVQAFDVKAKADGSSSIGVFALKAIVRLTRVTVTAYDGAVGKNGAPGAPGTYKTVSTNADGDGVVLAWGICTCNSGETTLGGSGENLNNTGQPAVQGQPVYPNGQGVHGNPGFGTVQGFDGDPGPNGTDAAKSTSLGVLSETDWLPHPGDDGVSSGKVGQGGGGGGCGSQISTCLLTTHLMGSGAGCGGCGGGPGKGGTGGGSSFAIVSIDTALTANECAFTAGAGARGGDGGGGGAGGAGGKPGVPTSGTSPPGHGGKGGTGGGGAGGAGGLAAGVFYRGAPPILDAGTLAHITIGAAGAGGTRGGTSFPINDGASGKADKLLDYNKL